MKKLLATLICGVSISANAASVPPSVNFNNLTARGTYSYAYNTSFTNESTTNAGQDVTVIVTTPNPGPNATPTDVMQTVISANGIGCSRVESGLAQTWSGWLCN